MLNHGIHIEHASSLWTPLPILTVLGVMGIRVSKGLAFLFETPAAGQSLVALRNTSSPALMLVLTTAVLAAQLILGFVGYAVMKRVGYQKNYVGGSERSPGAYALVCPGTGVFVFGMFFLHTGLVQTGLLERFSPLYFVLLALFVPAQLYAIVTMFRLDSKLLCPARLAAPSAEAATA